MIKLYFLLSFLPLLCYSHEDAYHLVEYGNVTVRFKTGHYYEEVENAKIIGQYALIQRLMCCDERLGDWKRFF